MALRAPSHVVQRPKPLPPQLEHDSVINPSLCSRCITPLPRHPTQGDSPGRSTQWRHACVLTGLSSSTIL